MTATGIAANALSETEHGRQLRRAVVASTVGTVIEAYDFLLYVLVAPLVFANLYFPASDPLVGTLQAFGIYAVGFIARPVGAALFGHYGDRIGRKTTLIATLLLTGLSTFAVGFVPGYASIGIWGAVILTIVRFIQGLGIGGEWGGATLMSMEWARTDAHRGFITSWPQWGGPAGLFFANLAVLAFSAISGDQFLDMGMARPVLALDRHGRDRALHPPRHLRDAGFRADSGGTPSRTHAGDRSDQTAAEADHSDRAGADGGARSVLCLCRLPVHLRDDGIAQLARPAAERAADGHRAVGGDDPAVRVHLRSHRPQADVSDRRGRNRACSPSSISR